MTPTPKSVGLHVCQQIVIDKHTSMPTCVGIFTGLVFDKFPSPARDIWVYSALSDSAGIGTMEIVILDLSGEGAEIYSNAWKIEFPDRLTVVDASILLKNVVFPSAGVYSVSMLIDEETVADRRIRVRKLKESL